MIEEFHSNIIVHENAQVSVEETIVVDFGRLKKHGIYRNIPVNYRDRFGNKLKLRFQVLAVTDEFGIKRPFRKNPRGEEVEIKIGDPKKTISGIQTYIIRYQVERVIVRFEEHDELYWNITGNDWPVTIKEAWASVYLPTNAQDATCFSGTYGSNLQNCAVETFEKEIEVWANTTLYPGSGLTIVIAIPKGTVQVPPLTTRLWWFISDNWPYAIPVLTFLALGLLYWQHGRDERYKSLFDPSKGAEKLPLFTSELIPSTYAPLKDIKPAEAGTLIDEEVNIRDIAATIIDLTVRGFIRIEELEKSKGKKKKDFALEHTGKDESELEEYEKKLLKGLFKLGRKTTLSAQKYHFYSHLPKIRDSLYEKIFQQGYFKHRPDKVVAIYRGIGIALIGTGIFGGVILGSFTGQFLVWIAGLVGAGVLFILFAKAMPKKTAKGRRQFLRVLGLRNFISLGAYREQIWERANLFEELLPYAIAFNLTHQWAEAFKIADIPPPNWYRGLQPFNTYSFTHSIENFTQTATTNLPATRSTSASSGISGFSAGGGFSGGGFGGGGGGSW